MRNRLLISTVLLGAGLVPTLAACSGQSSGGSGGSSTASVTATGSSSGTSPTSTASPTTPAASPPGSVGTTSATSGVTGAPVAACRPTALSLRVAVPAGTGAGTSTGAGTARIVITNTGTATCGLRGVPITTLSGPDDPTFGPVYRVADASFPTPTLVTLRPGAQAHAVIQFLPPVPSAHTSNWTPTRVTVLVPGATRSLSATWPGVAMQRQDAATHSGTWVGPVQPGAS